MKRNNVAKFVVLGLAVLMATAAFASNKGSFHVQEAVEVNGQQLPAGEYQVRWEGSGDNVQLSFMQGKKEFAKTTAKVVQLDQTPNYDSAVIDHSSGKASLSEIRFAGKKASFTLGKFQPVALASAITGRRERFGAPFFVGWDLVCGQHVVVVVDERALRGVPQAFQRQFLVHRRIPD